MSKKQSVLNRKYTDEFKVEAVRLAESIGGNPAAKRLDIPESSLWNWIKLSRAGRLSARLCTSRMSRPNAVSSPDMPVSAWSNSHALSIQRRGE